MSQKLKIHSYVEDLQSQGIPHIFAVNLHVKMLRALGASSEDICKRLVGLYCGGWIDPKTRKIHYLRLMCDNDNSCYSSSCFKTIPPRGSDDNPIDPKTKKAKYDGLKPTPCCYDCNIDDCLKCEEKRENKGCSQETCCPDCLDNGGLDVYCACKQEVCNQDGVDTENCLKDPSSFGDDISQCCNSKGYGGFCPAYIQKDTELKNVCSGSPNPPSGPVSPPGPISPSGPVGPKPDPPVEDQIEWTKQNKDQILNMLKLAVNMGTNDSTIAEKTATCLLNNYVKKYTYPQFYNYVKYESNDDDMQKLIANCLTNSNYDGNYSREDNWNDAQTKDLILFLKKVTPETEKELNLKEIDEDKMVQCASEKIKNIYAYNSFNAVFSSDHMDKETSVTLEKLMNKCVNNSTKSKWSLSLIIGIVIGSVLLFGLLGFLIWYFKNKRN